MNKPMHVSILAVFALAAGAALADDRDDDDRYGNYRKERDRHYHSARVVAVDPIYREVRVSVPRQDCYVETRYQTVRHGGDQPAAGQMIIGGLIGAAIGNKIGHGRQQRNAAIAGAVIGSAIGHDAAQRSGGRAVSYEEVPVEVERCDLRYEQRYEQRVDGYRVTYRYNGRLHSTVMPYDPGDRLEIRADVAGRGWRG